ncbi:MAG: type IV pilus twitching motility protein PilT [Candidatus Dormibacteria bacterium]
MARTPDDYMDLIYQQGASDLLLTAGAPPTMRVNGDLVALEPEPLSPADVGALLKQFLSAERMDRLQDHGEVDFALHWQDKCRFRANAYRQRGSLAIALRRIPYAIPSMADLGLPESVQSLAKLRQGLVLVTGPTGSGKSTTIASMLDWINANRAFHIVTIEDPMEYVHRHQMSVVDQREVGVDTSSFASALRSALRQDPDVILVGEMRDLETIAAAITVAETGHLVFATLHTNDTSQAVDRIIDVFPGEQQQQIRIQMANTLAGVVYQQLLPGLSGSRVAAYEVLLPTTAVRNMIREGETRMIRNAVATGSQQGMLTLERSLNDLIVRGLVSYEEAAMRSRYPQELSRMARSGAAG